MSPNNNSDPVIDALEKQLKTAEEKLGDQLQLSVDRCQKVLNSEKEKLAKGKETVKAAKLRLRYAKGNNTQLARAKRSMDNIEAKQALLEASYEEARQAAKLAKHQLGRHQAAQKAIAQVDKEAAASGTASDAKAPATKTVAKKAADKKAPAKKAAAKSDAPSKADKKAPAKKAAAKKASGEKTAAAKPAADKAPAKKAPAKKAAAKKPTPAKAATASPEQPKPPAKKAAKARRAEPAIERTVPPPSQTTTPKGKKDRLRSLFDAID